MNNLNNWQNNNSNNDTRNSAVKIISSASSDEHVLSKHTVVRYNLTRSQYLKRDCNEQRYNSGWHVMQQMLNLVAVSWRGQRTAAT